MSKVSVALLLCTSLCHGFSISTKRSSLRMDAGEDQHMAFIPHVESLSIPTLLRQQQRHVVETSQAGIGMPWAESVVSSQELTFMPFWEHQMEFMKNQLTNLRSVPVTNKAATMDFSISEGKNVRVANLSFTSSQFRKIRVTYYDAGPQAQVFNCLWYPAPEYNLPVLGIDLIQFNGGKKHLAVMDFQPVQETEDQHASAYEHLLEPIRDQYPSLQGKMSARFYDEKRFFSKQMLFARFDDEAVVESDVWPAFQQYLGAYMDLIHQTKPDLEGADQVLDRQRAYDVYSAQRDPALHMFKAKFGDKWADEFVHEFLFDMCR